MRSVQVSKAFGAGHASASQVDNFKGLAEVAPAAGAVINSGARVAAVPVRAAPLLSRPAVVRPAIARPAIVSSPIIRRPAVVAHAPVITRPAVVAHAPVIARPAVVAHAAPALVAHAPAVYEGAPEPYTYEYGVADDYSGAAFNAAESADGTGVVQGSYSVNLPDGRTQHVNYSVDPVQGYVADVNYEGVPVYPEVKPYVPAPRPGYIA